MFPSHFGKPNPNLNMGKGGTVNRLEPDSFEFCDWNACVWFKSVGSYEFIKKFSGENYAVSKTFSLSFNGVQVQVRPGVRIYRKIHGKGSLIAIDR